MGRYHSGRRHRKDADPASLSLCPPVIGMVPGSSETGRSVQEASLIRLFTSSASGIPGTVPYGSYRLSRNWQQNRG